jgi:N-acetylglucosaminyldiphosphoundecaprenol N-acetyl-beta-D-mannosaminyltransferase
MSTTPESAPWRPIKVWGVPFAPLTFAQTLDEVARRIAVRKPGYVITANLHYAMLTARDSRLPPLNDGAQFIVADGMPLVWASRWRTTRLPERVTGSDLVPALCARAAERDWRIFLLGGEPGIGDEAARKLREKYPTLQIVGVEAPPFRAPTPEEHAALIQRIRDSKADLLFVAFGQPKGELWMQENCAATEVPVSIQVGATLNFLAGHVRRAPMWIQRLGIEWVYRLWAEPKRLFGRYWSNGLFALRMLFRDACTRKANRQ